MSNVIPYSQPTALPLVGHWKLMNTFGYTTCDKSLVTFAKQP